MQSPLTAMVLKKETITRLAMGAVCFLLAVSVLPGRVEPTDNLAALTILYTNDTRGYLQTCGCSHSGLGGLDRRATLVKQVRAEQPHVLMLDSGNQAEEPDRAGVIFEALAAMGYDALGIGSLDLALKDRFFSVVQTWGLTVVISPPRPSGVPTGVPEVVIKEIAGHRVAILALTPLDGNPSEESIQAELRSTLEQARAGADLVVVLSQRGLARDQRLATEFSTQPGIDLIIGNTEAQSLREPEVIGRTWLLPTSERGQHVGRVDVTWNREELHFQARLIPLNATFAAEPTIEGIVGKYYAAQAQALLDASLRRKSTGELPVGSASVVEATYVPAEKCAICHRSQYEQWLTHKHAHAVETLAAKQRLVSECLPCHSEQYRRTGKFVPNLGPADGVQCSTCHGDGIVHSLAGRHDRVQKSVPEHFCQGCHDAERDPDFQYDRAAQSIHEGTSVDL